MRKCAELMIKSLIGLEFGKLSPTSQDHSLAVKHSALPMDKIKHVEKLLGNKN